MGNSITGNKIRHLRELRNLTQDHMARQLGMDQSQYSKIETGKAKPDQDKLVKIAEALDVPLAELVSPEPLVLNMQHANGKEVANGSRVQQELPVTSEQFLRELVGKLEQHIQELNRLNNRLTDLLERQLDKR